MPIFDKLHLDTAFIVLDAKLHFKADFEVDMLATGLDKKTITKCLLLLDMLHTKIWATNDDVVLHTVISYVLWKLVQNKSHLDTCVYEVDRLARTEQRKADISMPDYLNYRRTFFELKKIVAFIVEHKSGSTILRLDNHRVLLT